MARKAQALQVEGGMGVSACHVAGLGLQRDLDWPPEG